MPQKSWAVGEEVLAADFNTYLQNQCVPAFTGTTQRDSQWASPPRGAMCVTVDTDTLWERGASAWYQPYSEVAFASLASDYLGIGTTAVTVLNPTYTLYAASRIGIVCAGSLYKGGADATGISVVALKPDGAAIGDHVHHTMSANQQVGFSCRWSLNQAAGVHTCGVAVLCTGASVNVLSNTNISVVRLGPQ